MEAPLQARWKIMGPEEAKRLHARAQEQHERFRQFGPRRRRRLAVRVAGTALGFGALAWFFVAGDLRTIGVYVLVGIPVGALVAWTSPGGFVTAALYAVAGFVATWIRQPFASLGWRALPLAILGAFLMGCVGFAIGRTEADGRDDLQE